MNRYYLPGITTAGYALLSIANAATAAAALKQGRYARAIIQMVLSASMAAYAAGSAARIDHLIEMEEVR